MFESWPKAALFDLDGTLIDSVADIAAALARLLVEEGLPPLSTEAVVPLTGDGAGILVERAFALAGRMPPADGLARFVARYGAAACVETRLFPGVEDTLQALSGGGCKLAVATNKPAVLARSILQSLGVAPLFQAVAGGDSYPERKPHPGHLLCLLRDLEVPVREALMIGDSRNDVLAARAAGLPVVVCSFGYSKEPAGGLGADRVIDGFAELPGAMALLRSP